MGKPLTWRRRLAGSSLVSSRNVMAVYPDSLAVSIPPMSWSPNVIRTAGPVAWTTNIIRPILNRDYDRPSSVVWPGAVTIVRSIISWVSGVIAFAAPCPEQGRNQKNQQNQSSRSGFCFIRSCSINNAHLHNQYSVSAEFYAPAFNHSEIAGTISRSSCFPGRL